jgi:hypothetical protein
VYSRAKEKEIAKINPSHSKIVGIKANLMLKTCFIFSFVQISQSDGKKAKRSAPLAAESTATTPSAHPDELIDSWDSANVSLQLIQSEEKSNCSTQENPSLKKQPIRLAQTQSTTDSDLAQSASAKSKVKEGDRKLGPKFSFRLFKMNSFFSGQIKQNKTEEKGKNIMFSFCDG